jgi:hypothetical protein
MRNWARRGFAIVFGMVFSAFAADARADIIILTGNGVQSTGQGENILFNNPNLADQGFTVQGYGKDSGTIFDISSDVEIDASGGQAKITALNAADVFDLFYFRPDNTSLGLGYFEASVSVAANANGSATLTACNQLGGFGSAPTFTPAPAPVDDGPCEAATWDLKNGNNFFVIQVVNPQLLRGLLLTTTTGILDISQIRVDGLTEFDDLDVNPTGGGAETPEPASLVLLGTGLLAGARRMSRRRSKLA